MRCSTIEQNEARQLKMMEEQKAEKLFIDKASGKNTDRRAFKEMMAFVRAGDMVIVESISRIARNTRDLLSIVSELTEKQVEFISLKENIDTTTPQGRFMLTVFGALAELERDGLVYSQRTTGRFVTEDQAMIASAKRSLAERHIQAFLEAMTHLGYDREEILTLLRQEESKGGENNGSSGV